MLTPHDILGEGQKISKRLEADEHRPEQLEMADAVADAIASKRHLVAEAGTGVGKSFGYLVPAILSLAANQESKTETKKRIVVSTHTISLQEQLIEKDVPFLNSTSVFGGCEMQPFREKQFFPAKRKSGRFPCCKNGSRIR